VGDFCATSVGERDDRARHDIALHRRARRATAVAEHPLLRRSTLAHLPWRAYAARYEHDVTKLRA